MPITYSQNQTQTAFRSAEVASLEIFKQGSDFRVDIRYELLDENGNTVERGLSAEVTVSAGSNIGTVLENLRLKAAEFLANNVLPPGGTVS